MATLKRNNHFARWTVILATGLATFGFWTGIINGPLPAQGAGPGSAAAQQSSTNSQGVGRSLPGFSTSPSFSSPQFSAPPPRFRTRGS